MECIDAYAVFLEFLPATHMCLQAISIPICTVSWVQIGVGMGKQSPRPMVICQLQSSSFLVSFQILVQVLHILRELTVKLQMKAVDIVQAYKMVEKVVSTFKSILRHKSATEYRKQFVEATRIGKRLHRDDFETPRLSGHQVHRNNPPLSTPEDYYRMMSSCHMLLLSLRKGLLTIHLTV